MSVTLFHLPGQNSWENSNNEGESKKEPVSLLGNEKKRSLPPSPRYTRIYTCQCAHTRFSGQVIACKQEILHGLFLVAFRARGKSYIHWLKQERKPRTFLYNLWGRPEELTVRHWLREDSASGLGRAGLRRTIGASPEEGLSGWNSQSS